MDEVVRRAAIRDQTCQALVQVEAARVARNQGIVGPEEYARTVVGHPAEVAEVPGASGRDERSHTAEALIDVLCGVAVLSNERLLCLEEDARPVRGRSLGKHVDRAG